MPLDVAVNAALGALDHSSNLEGDLNYLISSILDKTITGSYKSINAAIGVLECAKLELYRRVAAPYEDTKKELNGDVYSS